MLDCTAHVGAFGIPLDALCLDFFRGLQALDPRFDYTPEALFDDSMDEVRPLEAA